VGRTLTSYVGNCQKTWMGHTLIFCVGTCCAKGADDSHVNILCDTCCAEGDLRDPTCDDNKDAGKSTKTHARVCVCVDLYI